MSARLVRQTRLRLDTLAAHCGVHPDLVRRLTTLGLLEPVAEARRGDEVEVWFLPDQAARLARLLRLKADLSLNYAALGLVIDLLERIDALEAELRRRPAP